jgi:solute carrier family 25 protein 16
MPSALISNASLAASGYKPREVEMDGRVRRRDPEPVICPTDEDVIAKKPHKQSFDYIWRTGFAGGVAASAVCSPQFPHTPSSLSNMNLEQGCY